MSMKKANSYVYDVKTKIGKTVKLDKEENFTLFVIPKPLNHEKVKQKLKEAGIISKDSDIE